MEPTAKLVWCCPPKSRLTTPTTHRSTSCSRLKGPGVSEWLNNLQCSSAAVLYAVRGLVSYVLTPFQVVKLAQWEWSCWQILMNGQQYHRQLGICTRWVMTVTRGNQDEVLSTEVTVATHRMCILQANFGHDELHRMSIRLHARSGQ